ncbi:DUF2934 domain-containing protein [Oleiharenicola lentus]|uniref:DUF2934 domain-containing protein n=1 Tax=Oleiharenicola lentus TaxID=2508720 RepID=UPI003F6629AE
MKPTSKSKTPLPETTLPKQSSNNLPTPDAPVSPDLREVSLRETISERAYYLWQKYGEPDGRSAEIWLEAERQLLGSDARINQQATGAVSAPALGAATKPAARNLTA